MQFIDLKTQYQLISEKVQARINTVLEHGQYIMGPEISELESQLADFVGAKHAIVNASGTDALLMSLLALEIQAGDEIITTPFSFFATAEVIALIGAKPVFVDIDKSTYNIDHTRIEAAITPKTKAIMPVSLYGQTAEMNIINEIAKKYGLPVIEDAAQSFGATHHGMMSCNLSTIGCTSFFPSKPLGGYGDSGACFTNDDVLAERLREVRIHGQSGRYIHDRIGINGRMDTIQAAILIEKLAIFKNELILRSNVASKYIEKLEGQVKLQKLYAHNTSPYAQFTLEVNNRDEFAKTLSEFGVPTAVHYPSALHLQKSLAYLGYKEGDFPIAENAASHVISLPMHPYLTESQQNSICDAVLTAVCRDEVMA